MGPTGSQQATTRNGKDFQINDADNSKNRCEGQQRLPSDPRLSQLLAISSHLEALAECLDFDPHDAAPMLPLKRGLQTETYQGYEFMGDFSPQEPPELPPRANHSVPPPPPTPARGCQVKDALEVGLDDEEIPKCFPRDAPLSLNAAPPPRYSIMSDSQTSSSTRSATLGSSPTSGQSSDGSSEVVGQQRTKGTKDSKVPRGVRPDLKAEIGKAIDKIFDPRRTGSGGERAVDQKLVPPDPDFCWSMVSRGPQPDGAADLELDPAACWQSRCMELEFSLQRFRDQAQSIRELLRDKVRYNLNHFNDNRSILVKAQSLRKIQMEISWTQTTQRAFTYRLGHPDSWNLIGALQ